jgi:exopolysaccharide biosynthesis polyprenyl glycosylphosphotransferase
MLARRNSGLVTLHKTLVSLEAAALWVVMSQSGIRFTTLLPYWAYPVAVAFGVLLATENTRQTSLSRDGQRATFIDCTRLALRQVAFACGSIFTVVVLFKDPGISRFFLLMFFSVLGPILAVLNRHQPRWIAWRFFFEKKPIPTLLIGGTSRFPNFESWMKTNLRVGALPVGHLSYRDEPSPLKGVPSLGSFHDLSSVMANTPVSQVVMLDQPDSTADAEKLLQACLAHGSRLLIHNNFGYKLGYPLQMIQEDNYSFLTLHDEPLEEPLNRGLKRALDIGVSIFVLLFVFPPLALVVSFMHRRQSPGPLFHAQLRTGHNRSRFMILKFRSMHVTNDDENRQADKTDARVFSFGRRLRRSSLDEIPQFINVLRGEMSTVGPRPHLLAHSDAFSRDLDVYLLRYFAKPGITGLAQCNGYRGLTGSPEVLRGRVQLDLEYIRNWSIWMDIVIIIKTARQVLFPPATAH